MMMPPYSCATPGRKPGTSTSVRIGMLKASQKRTKRAALRDESMSSTPARYSGWFATMPTRAAGQPREADDDVLRELRVHFHEVAGIDDLVDHLAHVVALGRVVRHDVQQVARTGASTSSPVSIERRVFHVVQRQEREQPPHFEQRVLFVLDGEVGDAAARWRARWRRPALRA